MRNKIILFLLICIVIFGACEKKESTKEKQLYQVNYEKLKKEDGNTQYEMNGKRYDYLLRVLGNSNNAKNKSYYIVLSNNIEVTFKEVDERFWSSHYSEEAEEAYVIVEAGLVYN